MTSGDGASLTPEDEPPSLEKALEQNQEVKDQLENCAADLFSLNETVMKEMAVNNPSRKLEKNLEKSQSVESQIQECAGKLEEVNEALAHEVDGREKLDENLRETREELSATRNALSGTQDALAAAHEITRQAAAQLERLRATLDRMGDAVITTDIYGNVTYLNPVAETMTGWRSEEAKGHGLQDVFNIIHVLTKERALNPVDSILQGKISAGLAPLTALIQRSGKFINIEDSAAPIRNQQGNIIGAVLIFHDAALTQDMEAQIAYQATHDTLTGLINRREFERHLEQALLSGKTEGKHHTLLHLDIDHFKIMNDTAGHVAGDELLKQLTGILQAHLGANDTLARVGGDEFGLLLDSCPLEAAQRMASLLREAVYAFPFSRQEEGELQLGLSIGLVSFGGGGETLPDILRMAEAACHLAKEKGRNRTQIYAAEDTRIVQLHGEMGWVGRIQKALAEQQRLVLYSQKILPLAEDGQGGEHYEVLLRMLDDDGKLIPPMAFIPAAERYGLMAPLDRWVISTAFAQYARRHPHGTRMGTCAINLSAASICDENFYEFVLTQFDFFKVPPGGICFEITETAAIANLAEAAKLIRKLKERGCRFSLDDFGSGMSSFAYLKHFPVDYLKIDGSFVKDMLDNSIDLAMVEAINHIGHVMQICTIAEFVENTETLEALRTIGVDYAQGYGIEKPRLNEGV
ncbi:MAG: EAL domain-containing protein [Nitrosospira sp.]